MNELLKAIFLVALCGISCVQAQDTNEATPTEGSADEKYDRMTRVSAAEAVAPLGDNLFGDSTNYYNGTTTFSVTDIDLPGNSALPVRVTRTHSATESRGKLATGLMGEWELELPHIHGTYSHDFGWRVSGPNPFARCSVAPADRNPPPATTTVEGAPAAHSFLGEDFWSGNSLAVPGAGDQALLVRSTENTLVPTDGHTYPWTTLNHWQLRCLPTLANGEPGEGFFALGPDGTKYTFNWMVSRPKDIVQKSKFYSRSMGGASGLTANYQLHRDEYRIYATRVEDRFGNWVNYSYIGEQIQRIEANDGRVITFDYDAANGKLKHAYAHGRTWTYNYSQSKRLTSVVLPDQSQWTYDTTPMIYVYEVLGSQQTTCALGNKHSSVTRAQYFFTHPTRDLEHSPYVLLANSVKSETLYKALHGNLIYFH